MTNAKQMKWLFRGAIERNPELVQVRSYAIWIRPIRHFIAQVWIDGCLDPNAFTPNLSITPLYWGGVNFDVDVGSFNECFLREPRPAPFTREYFLNFDREQSLEKLKLPAWRATVGDWEWSVPDIDRIFTRAVEEQVLPLLRPMALDHRAYLDFYRSYIVPYGGLYAEQRIAIAIAEGALDEARWFLAKIWKRYEKDKYGDYETPEPTPYPKRGQRSRRAVEAWEQASFCRKYRAKRRRILEIVEPLQAGDRAALAAILHRWEAEAVGIHKVERYWEPTRFPIETGLA